MNRHSEYDTREHIPATGEQSCMHRGFTGMGLSESLKTAEVPKGSFYHCSRSKEAFGVAPLGHHYIGYLQCLANHFDHGDGNYRDRLLTYYQYTLNQFCQQGITSGCPAVKLSAEVCDLSEDMRIAIGHGASQIIALLDDALEEGRQEGSLAFDGETMILSQVLYSLWLGANLQAKTTCSVRPLESAPARVKQIVAASAAWQASLPHQLLDDRSTQESLCRKQNYSAR